MMTIRQLERFWLAKQYDRMLRSCLEMRTESSVRLMTEISRGVPAAAMAVIRLDELGQAHQPFSAQMIRVILAAQESDGGWGDPITTALCLRALLCGHGDGGAVDRGMEYLANLQRDEGVWPRVPLRRLPADAYTSAFILFQLSGHTRFHDAIRVADALDWFDAHAGELDVESQRLWRQVSARFGLRHRDALATWS